MQESIPQGGIVANCVKRAFCTNPEQQATTFYINNNIWHLHSLSVDESQSYV